jgi:phage FluMu protein Com
MTLLAAKERETMQIHGSRPSPSGEVVVFCPQCKAIQTVQISGSRLTPTRKFTQVGTRIYHDCGSNRPCRLYHNM